MTARFLITLFVAALAACTKPPAPVAPMRESGELVVLTVNGPATYFEDAHGNPSGLEYDLATAFARELRLRVRFVVADDASRLDRMLREGQAHMAAASMARHFDFPGGLAWGPSYFTTQHQLVSRTGEAKPKSLADIGGRRVGVIEESVAEYFLSVPSKLPVTIESLPPATSTADLLEKVARRELDYALVESNRFTLARRHFPQVDVAFGVGKPVDYAWLFASPEKRQLSAAAGPFFARLAREGTLKRLVDRYYGHAAIMTAIDSGTLIERVATQLPSLKPHFLEAETVSGIDWRLVAAIGYQESHWDASATSPTGVRGLMMLTDETASRLEVKNRLDARESIIGGARYFALLKEALSPRIAEPDRTFLALAAYNLGLGHLEDARVLAQRAKLDPDKWQDVRQVMGKLADPDAFQTLKHGYARGHEAVRLVDNVRNYYEILQRMEPRHAPAMPATPGGAAPQSSLNASPAGR